MMVSTTERHPTERRKPQRDWLGHGLQLGGVLIALLGAAMWLNYSIATLNQRVDRQEHDNDTFRSFQALVTTQVLEVNKQLATIAAQLPDIRENIRDIKEHRRLR